MSAPRSGIGMTSQRTRLRMIERLRAQGIRDETVLAAMAEVPRHLFIDEGIASRAYEDISLPIGFGQTISSPHTVARMSELARAGPKTEKVLEIGTGCGYQTAILAKLARQVYSMERIAALVRQARRNLLAAGIKNVHLRHGDGHAGMPALAPFDVIMLTAAAVQAPAALLEQLAVGGRMILPMMNQRNQHLVVIERTDRGHVERRMDSVKFVPMLPGIG
ncbi:MAG TPA: protein-L-isoaspartate(D-aspartate) O-methyltransferase [Burkholderiales bacterium]|jgi:protein-L-isoaspartate(D-aspartate) O-methyltransferase|nr:protein-L-isoaspartate(D-aspartate) O-methyltransferase [Burkholderiales bacterium]